MTDITSIIKRIINFFLINEYSPSALLANWFIIIFIIIIIIIIIIVYSLLLLPYLPPVLALVLRLIDHTNIKK